MKLYLFEAGAGWDSYAVMAASEAEAEALVQAASLADHLAHCAQMRERWPVAQQYKEADARAWHGSHLWPNERKQMEVRIAEPGQVLGIWKDE